MNIRILKNTRKDGSYKLQKKTWFMYFIPIWEDIDEHGKSLVLETKTFSLVEAMEIKNKLENKTKPEDEWEVLDTDQDFDVMG